MKVPFGKYRGRRVKDLPDHYVRWLFSQDWLEEPLRGSIEAEWDYRFHERDNRHPQRLLTGEVQELASEIVDSGFRALAKKFHPDCGGSHETMIKLISAKDVLEAILQGKAA